MDESPSKSEETSADPSDMSNAVPEGAADPAAGDTPDVFLKGQPTRPQVILQMPHPLTRPMTRSPDRTRPRRRMMSSTWAASR